MASDHIYPDLKSEPEDYRLKKISDVQTAIETELGHYEQVLKKYKRTRTGLTRCAQVSGALSALISGGSLATALSGFGIIIGAPLAGVAGVFGIVSVTLAAISKRFESKISKHDRTVQLAKSKLSSIVELISKALSDGRVSHEEFTLINAELVRFRQLKNEIRRKAPQEAQPTLETANVEERVRKEILNSLTKKLESK